jgi:hypothetical protein
MVNRELKNLDIYVLMLAPVLCVAGGEGWNKEQMLQIFACECLGA